MGITKEEFRSIFEEKFGSNVLLPEDIPNIDLYIDQITTLFDSALSDRKRSEDEKILTKTMVNNYSKEGILRPIKAKKYSREHIIQMAMIYLMKQSLSIQDIKSILCSGKYKDIQSFEGIYEEYIQLHGSQSKTVTDFFVSMGENINTEDEEGLLSAILCLCSISSALVSVIETVIDRHFNLSDDEVKDKK